MREDFSADATCRLMGYAGLADPSWVEVGDLAFRTLLGPAFDDAVCLTVTAAAGEERATVAAVTLKRADWPGGITRRYLTAREILTIDRAVAESLRADLLLAHAQTLIPRDWGWRDGMGLNSAWVDDGQVTTNELLHVAYELTHRFAARLITAVHPASRSLAVYRALARAGDYVGLKLDRAFEPPTMIALIGDPWDKVGLKDALTEIEMRRPGRPRPQVQSTPPPRPPAEPEPSGQPYPHRQRRHHRK